MILATDPGLSGAFCLYDPATDRMEIEDVPTYIKTVNGKQRRVIDDRAVLGMFMRWSMTETINCFAIERVGGIKGQSASASFSFGYGYGIICLAAKANDWPFLEVEPATWKGALKVRGDAKASIARACDLMPQHASKWPLAKHDGRAEAAMIAWYVAHHMKRGAQ